jgi:multidrug efflux pump subunit AcrA (membrane-fusion protein)
MRKRTYIFIFVFIFAINGLYPSVKVETGKIIKKEISQKIEFEGMFSMEKTVNIFPTIRGVLIKLYKGENSAVKKGELIALVQRDDPGYKFKPVKIISPLKGVIVKINGYEGTRVNPQAPIMMIGSYNPIIFSVDIPVDFFYKIKKGDKAEINISGLKKVYSGIVYTKLNPANAKLKSAIVKIKVANPDFKIIPNIYGRAVISIGKKDLILAPSDAVFTSEGKYFVWVVENGRAFKREVEIGELFDKYFQITDGVSEGETVITFGAENLKNGDTIIY